MLWIHCAITPEHRRTGPDQCRGRAAIGHHHHLDVACVGDRLVLQFGDVYENMAEANYAVSSWKTHTAALMKLSGPPSCNGWLCRRTFAALGSTPSFQNMRERGK